MTRLNLTIIALFGILAAGCVSEGPASSAWSLADTELDLRCGEVLELPFTGGSADYTIHISDPSKAEVMAVNASDKAYPSHAEQALVFRGKSSGHTEVSVRDNRTERAVVIRLRVTDPYIALLGTPHTDPGRQDRLLSWDTNLYLNADGRFLLTSFTDGMAIKPALITGGTYTIAPTDSGFDITIRPDDAALPPQTYSVAASGELASILTTWDINRPDSDLAMVTLPNKSTSREARYWVTPSEHLPSGLAF